MLATSMEVLVKRWQYCGILLIFLIHSCAALAFHSKERMLKDYLFTNYDKFVRPIIEEDERVDVNLSLSVVHIKELDLDTQTLIFNGWIFMEWTDRFLTWNTSDFNGINEIRIPNEMLWKPDMFIYNSADSEKSAISSESMAVIYSNGLVLWVPPLIIHSYCNADLRYYPYDEHLCEVKIGSWTQSSLELKLGIKDYGSVPNKTVDLGQTDFLENNEWHLIRTTSLFEDTIYPCCKESYESILFTLHIKRKSSYYGCTLVVINIVAALATVCIFLLPPEKSKRIILAGINLIIVTLLILHLASYLPPSKNSVSVVVICPAVIAILSVLALMITALLLHLSNGSMTRAVPQCMHVFFLEFLGRFLCVNNIISSPPLLTIKVNDDRSCSVESSQGKSESGPGSRDMTREVDSQNLRHWYTVAVIINRLCLVCYIFIIIIVIIALCA